MTIQTISPILEKIQNETMFKSVFNSIETMIRNQNQEMPESQLADLIFSAKNLNFLQLHVAEILWRRDLLNEIGLGELNEFELEIYQDSENEIPVDECSHCATKYFQPSKISYELRRQFIYNYVGFRNALRAENSFAELDDESVNRIVSEIRDLMDGWAFQDLYCNGCIDEVRVFVHCDVIGHESSERFITAQDNGETYCESCMHRDGYFSGIDEVWYWNSESAPEYDEYDDYEDSSNFQLQNWKPNPKFHGSSETNSFFGIELEIEFSNSGFNIGETENLLLEISNQWRDGLWYHHTDGSLSNGIELVSHPMSKDFIQNDLKLDFIESLRERGFRSWDEKTCGIHIHCDRRGFENAVHSYAFANLIYCNPIEWQKMAGRNSSRFASFDPNARDLVSFEIKDKSRNRNRYVAVNCTNQNTFEIRIFRGSLNETRIRNAFELVIAAQNYTRKMTINEIYTGKLQWSHFAQYLRENKTQFPNANFYLEKYYGNEGN